MRIIAIGLALIKPAVKRDALLQMIAKLPAAGAVDAAERISPEHLAQLVKAEGVDVAQATPSDPA